MARGAFIVVEGLDRSGKSTQTAALCDRISSLGKSVKLYKFPGEYMGRTAYFIGVAQLFGREISCGCLR